MRAAVYARVSTEKQAEKYSLPTQKKLCVELCQKNEWEVVEVLVDDGYSGSLFEERPAFSRLLSLAQRRKIDVIVVTDVDRLARPDNLVDMGRLQQVLITSHVKLATLGGRISDLSNSSDWFFSSLESLMAGWERKKIKERVKRVVKEKKRQGFFWGVVEPSGYRWEGKNLVLRETREVRFGKHKGRKYTIFSADEIREIFDLYLAGHSVKTIAKRLNTTDSVVGPILDRAMFYAGWILEDYKDKHRHSRRADRMRKPLAKGLHPPIISEFEAKRVLKLRNEVHRYYKTTREKFPTYGLIKCGICGAPLNIQLAVKPSGRKYYYYICANRKFARLKDIKPCPLKWKRVDEIETQVWAMFERIITTPEVVFSLMKESRSHSDELREKLLRLEKDILDLSQRKRRLWDLFEFANTKEEVSNLKSRLERVELELAVKRQRKTEVEADLAMQESIPERSREITEVLRMLGDIVSEANEEERRELLRKVFSEVVLEEDGTLSYKVQVPVFKQESECASLTKQHPIMG